MEPFKSYFPWKPKRQAGSKGPPWPGWMPGGWLGSVPQHYPSCPLPWATCPLKRTPSPEEKWGSESASAPESPSQADKAPPWTVPLPHCPCLCVCFPSVGNPLSHLCPWPPGHPIPQRCTGVKKEAQKMSLFPAGIVNNIKNPSYATNCKLIRWPSRSLWYKINFKK